LNFAHLQVIEGIFGFKGAINCCASILQVTVLKLLLTFIHFYLLGLCGTTRYQGYEENAEQQPTPRTI